ncbi:MAG TPA: cupredoxin family copper-binding protein [Chloroflexia bacterium]|jgi:plastocyanin
MKDTIKRLLSVGLVVVLALPAFGGAPGYAQGNSRTFAETGKTVKGRFLEYWNQNGGLAQQGLPISEEMQEVSETDGKTYTVQYFERAVFESHPANPKPNDVLLSLLGNFLYQQKYPDGAPNQKVNTNNARKFEATDKTVGGKFRAYWEKNGGLAQQGYPISEEFQERSPLDGKTYTVQYFERAVFELHTENAPPFDVLLSQLGTFRYQARYGAAGTTGPKEVNVNIVNFKFDPDPLTIDVGTKVTWTQLDNTIHDATSKTKVWVSPIMNKGEKYSYTFTKAGTYDYWCTVHPEMLGKVIVK